VINAVGFLEGVGLGVICAVILFIVSYSRTDIVRDALTGSELSSNVVRPSLYEQLLREKGDWLYILKLQGFIFFGTGNRLFRKVQERVSESGRPLPHLVVFDFRLVTGLDASAILSFVKIKQLAEAHGMILVFSGLRGGVARQMENGLFTDRHYPAWRVFPDLDHALEWCEDHTIAIFEGVGLAARPKTLKQELAAVMPAHAGTLMQYLVCEEAEASHYLVRQGESPGGMIFIEKGQVSVQLEPVGKDPIRLRKMNAGTVVGEISTYLSIPASASVVTSQASTLYTLRLDALAKMERDHPEVASAFHRFMVRVVAERVAQTTDTLQKLT
jgi:SulP family sulfate permease